MNWVEFQDGCEMPEEGEVCIISDGAEWKIACRIGDEFHPVDEDESAADHASAMTSPGVAVHYIRADLAGEKG